MISRLTATAAAFAVIATTALGFAAEAQQPRAATVVPTKTVRIIELPRVVVTARRLDSTPR